MPIYDLLDTKKKLSKLVAAIETGRESEIVISRNGLPAARLVALSAQPRVQLGLAKGRYILPDCNDLDDAEIEQLFFLKDAGLELEWRGCIFGLIS
jgi:antitoxin (DNA-binding transcriptional repressor) of toxin-antitoxin stability system